MTISLKAQKMLWGRAAARCSMPDCRVDLYEDETDTDDPTLIGENCHIVAEKDGGPRADPTMPLERRNRYSNLILLCRNHHRIVDAQENEYTVECLQWMKTQHEYWVKDTLGLDDEKQKDEEYYSGLVDTWGRFAHLDRWMGWSSNVLSHGQPAIDLELDRDLKELRGWLLNRIWPERYADVESAFENFRRVLEDFQNVFLEHAETTGDWGLQTRRFYKIREWNEERYFALLKKYEYHVDLVQDLMLELSRAANLVCDRIRQRISSQYRLEKGHLTVQSGPHDGLVFRTFVVRYSKDECETAIPYPGLKDFMIQRSRRDRSYGEGAEPES